MTAIAIGYSFRFCCACDKTTNHEYVEANTNDGNKVILHLCLPCKAKGAYEPGD